MTTTNELDLLEQFRKEQEFTVELGEALKRLVANKDFEKVFTNYLFDTKLKQLVDELASTTAEPLLKKAQDNVRSIALVKLLLKEILNEHNHAKANLEATDEEILAYFRGE